MRSESCEEYRLDLIKSVQQSCVGHCGILSLLSGWERSVCYCKLGLLQHINLPTFICSVLAPTLSRCPYATLFGTRLGDKEVPYFPIHHYTRTGLNESSVDIELTEKWGCATYDITMCENFVPIRSQSLTTVLPNNSSIPSSILVRSRIKSRADRSGYKSLSKVKFLGLLHPSMNLKS
jgi:hypothetical protein